MRSQGREAASTAQQNELAFSNTSFNRQMAALRGIAGLYGVDTGLLGRALGIPAELLNVRANAARPSGFSLRWEARLARRSARSPACCSEVRNVVRVAE